jgi:uncharacterized protein YbaP (TraB family)
MKKIIFGFVLLVGLLAACDNSTQEPPEPTNATVWEISKDGNSIFLAGSVHMLRPRDYPMPAAFDAAFEKSSILVLETDVDRMDDSDMVDYQNEKFMLPEGQTLKTVLNSAVYARLAGLIGSDALEGELSQYKPSVVVNALEVAYLQQSGFTADGADFYYLAQSKQTGKDIGFLEDVTVQIDMLSDMADGIENEYVSNSLDALPNYIREVNMLISEWKNGISTTTEASLYHQKAEWPTIYETTILNRNSAWIPEIETYLTTQPVEFIIVGMAHLYGPDGLLLALKNRGYTLKQLIN